MISATRILGSMPVGPQEVTDVSTRLRRRVHIALALASVLPLLVLAYVMHLHLLRGSDPADAGTVVRFELLLLFTVLGMVAGAWLIWGLGRTVAQMARMMARDAKASALDSRTDEMKVVMTNFSRMLETIERQAGEIKSLGARLDGAYRDLESANLRLKETSFKDDVTGLYNRRFFTIRLEEEISRYRRFNHPLSVVLLDLDGFKSVNDDLGHPAGDETLRGMAEILLRHSRGINVICRYGGDEFAVLLVETSKAGARLYADRIRYVLSSYQFAHKRRVTASFGIASLPEDVAPTAEDLIQAADEALYAAKRSGKNRVSVHEDIGVVQAVSDGKGE